MQSSLGRGLPHRPALRETVRREQQTSGKPNREEQMLGFHGWNERGYLPHRDDPGLTQLVTFRLADSFPVESKSEWKPLFQIPDHQERRLQLEAWLDLGKGACDLKDERVATAVMAALQSGDGVHFTLLACTLMPNHVHVLFIPTGLPMKEIVKRWKGQTARVANLLLGRTGQAFWQSDYWDTYMRDEEHQQRALRYIRNNPVKAGLTTSWKQWRWTYLAPEV